MKFSIVTPSFRNSEWLRLCVASVSDQQGVEKEHLVHDAVSDDGTLDWLPRDPRVSACIEKDDGMYDAVNRGIRRSTGDVVAYLNCDEQYLPGALAAVREAFESDPEADIVIPDFVVIGPDGSYICTRVSMAPLGWHVWERFSVSTCSLFVRRRVFAEHGLWFDTRYKNIADFYWILEATRRGLKWKELRFVASAFTETGENFNFKPIAIQEKLEMFSKTPPLLKAAAPLVRWHHRYRMFVRNGFTPRPFEYQVYTHESPDRRKTFRVDKPTGRWPGRGTGLAAEGVQTS